MGGKLIGSAQLQAASGGLLQHGTLPLYGDVARICDVLRFDSDATLRSAKSESASTSHDSRAGSGKDFELDGCGGRERGWFRPRL